MASNWTQHPSPLRLTQSAGFVIIRCIIIEFQNLIKNPKLQKRGKFSPMAQPLLDDVDNKRAGPVYLAPVSTIRTYSFCYTPFSTATSTTTRGDITSIHLNYSFDTFTNVNNPLRYRTSRLC